MDFQLRRAALWASSLIAAVGCGGASYENVKGKVTLDGAPLSGAHVSIAPKDAAAVTDPALKGPFVGVTDADGYFELGPGDKPGGGAPSGAYTLGITTKTSSGDESAPPPIERVPAPYSSGGVDFEVPAGGVTDAKFDLTSK
jgi:hypothetical protein